MVRTGGELVRLEFRQFESYFLVFVVEEDHGFAGMEGDFRCEADGSLLHESPFLARRIFSLRAKRD